MLVAIGCLGQRPHRGWNNDPTVVGGALPRGSVFVVISSMTPAGGPTKHANHGQLAGTRGLPRRSQTRGSGHCLPLCPARRAQGGTKLSTRGPRPTHRRLSRRRLPGSCQRGLGRKRQDTKTSNPRSRHRAYHRVREPHPGEHPSPRARPNWQPRSGNLRLSPGVREVCFPEGASSGAARYITFSSAKFGSQHEPHGPSELISHRRTTFSGTTASFLGSNLVMTRKV